MYTAKQHREALLTSRMLSSMNASGSGIFGVFGCSGGTAGVVHGAWDEHVFGGWRGRWLAMRLRGEGHARAWGSKLESGLRDA